MVQAVKDVFGVWDSVIFAIMLILSAAVGMWYAYVDRKKHSTQEYLMGGRSLSVFPVAMSAWHGFMSAVTLLGTPVEVYKYGTQYVVITLSFFLVIPATAYFYLPVFYNLRLTSIYEYLGMRFHPYMRSIGSGVFFIHMIMYMPIVLYAPALALSEVFGIKVWTAVLATGLVCTFYTSIGGVKAVVWTDCFQSIVMYGAILIVIIKGTADLGGFDVVWQRSVESNRIEFLRFDFDPTIRSTIWSLTVGGYFIWTGNYAASQTMVQRYLTVKSLKAAQKVLWINLPAIVILTLTSTLCGLVVYAYYWDCDPIGAKLIQSPDQLVPRFVMETLGALPGLPGLFVAGVFSGAISTVATGVNSLAATILEDFIKIFIKKDLSEKKATRISKIITLILGLTAIALTFVADQMGGVLQAALTVHGAVGGPMLGLFTLGMFFPFVNFWGACVGLFSGFIFAMWLGIQSFVSHPLDPMVPMSYEGCKDMYYNATGIDVTGLKYLPETFENNSDMFFLYRLSYLWLSGIGFVIVLVVGILVSLVTGCRNGEPIDEGLITPVVVWLCNRMSCGRFSKISLIIQTNSFSLEKRKKNDGIDDDISRRASISNIERNISEQIIKIKK